MILLAIDKFDLGKVEKVFFGDSLNKFLTVEWWYFKIFYVILV